MATVELSSATVGFIFLATLAVKSSLRIAVGFSKHRLSLSFVHRLVHVL